MPGAEEAIKIWLQYSNISILPDCGKPNDEPSDNCRLLMICSTSGENSDFYKRQTFIFANSTSSFINNYQSALRQIHPHHRIVDGLHKATVYGEHSQRRCRVSRLLASVHDGDATDLWNLIEKQARFFGGHPIRIANASVGLGGGQNGEFGIFEKIPDRRGGRVVGRNSTEVEC